PGSIRTEGLNATTAWICWAGDVLVCTSTTDDDVRSPVVRAGERQQNASTCVGVRSVVSWEIWKLLDSGIGPDVENLRRLGDENEEVSIIEEVNERIHVVRLIFLQDLQRDVVSLTDGLGAQNFVCWIVICQNCRIK